MIRLKIACLFIFLTFLFLSSQSYGIEIDFSGFLLNETAFRADKSHDYTKIQNLMQLELKHAPLEMIELVVIGRGSHDSVYDVEDLDADVEEEYKNELTLRELYLDIFLLNADIRIGKQQVVWGEAVGLRITDVINPQDFREFILGDFIDSRIPLWLLKVDYYLGDFTIEGLLIPDFEPNKLAEEDSEWEFTMFEEDPPPGIRVDTEKLEAPEDGLEESELGLRISGMTKGWDWAVSYFATRDDFPTYHAEFDPATRPPTLTLTPKHHRLDIWGINTVKPFGPVIFSSEWAYYLNKFYRTEDSDDEDGVVAKDYLHYMVGAEYDIMSNLTVNGQFISRVISNYDDKLEEEKFENSYSIYLRSDFLHETLKPEILVIYAC